MAGFTTVQSVGSPADVPLRDAIAKGTLPGPRLLTAIEPLQGRGEQTGTPDEIRAYVRKQKEAGADLIKIFAAFSIRRPEMSLSQERLNAGAMKRKSRAYARLCTLTKMRSGPRRLQAAPKSSMAQWRRTTI